MANTSTTQSSMASVDFWACSNTSIANQPGKSLLLLSCGADGKIQACFQNASNSNGSDHEHFPVFGQQNLPKARNCQLQADQTVFVVPEELNAVLKFTLEYEKGQTCYLPPVLRQKFRNLTVWSCVMHLGSLQSEKVGFLLEDEIATLRKLCRAFPFEKDSNSVDVIPEEVRSRLITATSTSRKRSYTQPNARSAYELAFSRRASRTVSEMTPRSSCWR